MAADLQMRGPKGKPLVGSLFEFRRDPLGFLAGLAGIYGDIAHFKLGPQDVYLFNHPDYIKDVLVTRQRNFIKSRGLELAKRFLGEGLLTSEGDLHRRQRQLVQPAFHRQRVNSYASVMVDFGARTRERWRPGMTLDVSHEMMRLTLAVVAKTLFDADVENEAQDIGKALTEVMQSFGRVTLPFAELLDKLPLPSNRRFQKARQRLDATIYRIINERREDREDRGDLLSMLLLAQDEGDGRGMSDLQVRDEAMTLFLAGHETTANALTWSWYLLSQHSEAEARMHAEVDEAIERRLPGFDDVARLRYTEMVFAESMRLYPPAWVIGRRALADYSVNSSTTIPARSVILMSPYVMHHDPRYFPDPFKFNPDRWTTEAREARPKFSYFPFGAGPRVCIGESFAWMEGVLLLATLAQRWRLRLVPNHPVVPHPLITLRPKYGMRMQVEPR